MVIILVPKALVALSVTVSSQDVRRPMQSSGAPQAASSAAYDKMEYEFDNTSMQSQMAKILALANVGAGSNSYELYALALQNKLYIDYRSPCKDFAEWNSYQELEIIAHPEVAAEIQGTSLRKLQQELTATNQRALSSGESDEKAAASVADVVKKSLSAFQELKKRNGAADVFLWDLLASRYGCLELFMEIISSLQPGSNLHREILHVLCNCIQGKTGRNLCLASDATHITDIVELLQSKSIATIKVTLHIIASLLRAKNAYGIIKGCIKALCRKLNVPQWSILVTLLAEADVDVRYSALSLIVALGRSTAFAAADKLAAKAASTKFFLKLELAGMMKGLSIMAASNIADELKLVDQYTMLSEASPIPRSWRDCEILKQQLYAVEERCTSLEEQVRPPVHVAVNIIHS